MSSTATPSPVAPGRADRAPGAVEPRPRQWVLTVAAVFAAVAHSPVIRPHLAEAPYMGVLFVLLTVGCLAVGAAVFVRETTWLYAAAGAMCALAVLGYAATRLVAFPQLSDDVGNWFEPLGVISVVSESVVVAAAVRGIAARRRTNP